MFAAAQTILEDNCRCLILRLVRVAPLMIQCIKPVASAVAAQNTAEAAAGGVAVATTVCLDSLASHSYCCSAASD